MGNAQRSLAIIPEAWLTTDETAELLRVPLRTLRRHMEQYQVRKVPRVGSGGDRLEVLLSSLPIDAIDRWEAHQRIAPVLGFCDEADLITQAYERADQRTRKYFDRWSQALLATESISGRKALDEWVTRWNAINDDHQISVQSLYRVRAEVREQGRVGLLLRGSKVPVSTVQDDWFQHFCLAFLNENRLSVPAAHMTALGEAIFAAEKAGKEFDRSSFPSPASFMRRLEKEFSPAVIAFKRDGEKKFFDNFGYYIERDYSDLVSGRIWVGDSRVQDFSVRVEGKANPVRPWLTLFICMKSYVPMGWHLHESAPSAENTMRALRHGIVRIGKPEWWYLDNGREYRNNEVTGMSRGHRVDYDKQHTGSLAAMLGIQVHFAEVHRSRSKVIERQFKEMKNCFDRFWSTFAGGNSIEKPDRLKEILKRRSEIPTFEEVRDEMSHFCAEVMPQIVSNGKTHKGRSRAMVLEADYAIHGPLPRVSDDTAAMLVSKMARGRIGRRGFHLVSLNATWWAEWMPFHKGREVVLRYDPEDLRLARCYEATESGHGAMLGTCDLFETAGAMVRADDVYGLAQVAEGNKTFKREIRGLREFVPQADASDLARMRASYSKGVGSQPLQITDGNTTTLTEYDSDAAKIRREKRSGRADFSALIEMPAPKKQEPEWIWCEDQIASAG